MSRLHRRATAPSRWPNLTMIAGALSITVPLASGCGPVDDPLPNDGAAQPDEAMDDASIAPDGGPPRDAVAAVDVRPMADVPVADVPSLPSCSTTGVALGRVQGQVVSTAGTPVAGLHVNVCGALCITSTTNASGAFQVNLGECMEPSAEYPHGAVLTIAGLDVRPDYYFDFNLPGATRLPLVDLRAPFVSPTFDPARWTPAPEAGTSAVTVTDGQGFVLRVQPRSITYPLTTERQSLQALRVPSGRFPPLAGPGGAPAVLYAIGPVDTELSVAAALEFPNVTSSAPGARVDIVALGCHASRGRPAIGVFDRIGDGHVSADGRRITVDQGVRFLSWIGYRLPSSR